MNNIQMEKIEMIASDIFVLFGTNRKTCKVEFNLSTGKVRKINNRTVLDKNSIVFNRKVLEELSKKVNIEDLDKRMIETIKRGLIVALGKLGVKVITPEIKEKVQELKAWILNDQGYYLHAKHIKDSNFNYNEARTVITSFMFHIAKEQKMFIKVSEIDLITEALLKVIKESV